MSIKVANEASFLEWSSHLRVSGWCFLDLLISDQDGIAFPRGKQEVPRAGLRALREELAEANWSRWDVCESGFRMSLGPKQSRAGGRFTGEDGRGGLPWN